MTEIYTNPHKFVQDIPVIPEHVLESLQNMTSAQIHKLTNTTVPMVVPCIDSLTNEKTSEAHKAALSNILQILLRYNQNGLDHEFAVRSGKVNMRPFVKLATKRHAEKLLMLLISKLSPQIIAQELSQITHFASYMFKQQNVLSDLIEANNQDVLTLLDLKLTGFKSELKMLNMPAYGERFVGKTFYSMMNLLNSPERYHPSSFSSLANTILESRQFVTELRAVTDGSTGAENIVRKLLDEEDYAWLHTILNSNAFPDDLRLILLKEIFTTKQIAFMAMRADEKGLSILGLLIRSLCQTISANEFFSYLTQFNGDLFAILAASEQTRDLAERLYLSYPVELETHPDFSYAVMSFPHSDEVSLRATRQNSPHLSRRINGFLRHPDAFLTLIKTDPILAAAYMEIMTPDTLVRLLGASGLSIEEWIEALTLNILLADPTTVPSVTANWSGHGTSQRAADATWALFNVLQHPFTSATIKEQPAYGQVPYILHHLMQGGGVLPHRFIPEWATRNAYSFNANALLPVRVLGERLYLAIAALLRATEKSSMPINLDEKVWSLIQILFFTHPKMKTVFPYALLERTPANILLAQWLERIKAPTLDSLALLIMGLPHSRAVFTNILVQMRERRFFNKFKDVLMAEFTIAELEYSDKNQNRFKSFFLTVARYSQKHGEVLQVLYDMFPTEMSEQVPEVVFKYNLTLTAMRDASAPSGQLSAFNAPVFVPPPPDTVSVKFEAMERLIQALQMEVIHLREEVRELRENQPNNNNTAATARPCIVKKEKETARNESENQNKSSSPRSIARRMRNSFSDED